MRTQIQLVGYLGQDPAGALEPRTYESGGETRMSLDVRANEVHFLGEKGNGKSSTPASSSTGDTSPPASGRGDEDIPF